MIEPILRCARRLDAWLRLRVGPPYHAILGIGLAIEIGRNAHELMEIGRSPAGIFRITLQLVLYSALLVHQLGELYAHLETRHASRYRPPLS
ncbi:MAG TPA: hypothetical protein VME41_12090 [Stellaceae bacterium]|nr:hypothetical protein [Stellaceae bacterium]